MSDCFDHAWDAYESMIDADYDRDHGTPWARPYWGKPVKQRIGATCRFCSKPGLWSFQGDRWVLVHNCDGPPVSTLADFEVLS